MEEKIKKKVRRWTNRFIKTLEDTGLQKKDIAESLAIHPKTISNWLRADGAIPRKTAFVRLAISCVRTKGLNLNGETIGGSMLAGSLMGARFGGIVGGAVGLAIGAVIASWVNENTKEKLFIEELSQSERDNEEWEDILYIIDENKSIFP